MTASTATTVSPSRVRMARKTPWADGCCGPMFMVRRSLPPYPISTTFRASTSIVRRARFAAGRSSSAGAQKWPPHHAPPSSPASGLVHLSSAGAQKWPPHSPSPLTTRASTHASFHWGVGGGVEDDGLHVGEERDGLAQELLPGGVLPELGAGVPAVVQVAIRPHVDDLVELARLRLPEAHAPRVLVAGGHDRLEVLEPLARPAGMGAVPAQLVDIARVGGRRQGQLRRQDLVLLGDQERADLRDVLRAPPLILSERRPELLALVEVGVAPQVHE